MVEQMDLTSLWNGARGRSAVVYFWYLLISLRATVPGLRLNCFLSLTPPAAGAVFLLPEGLVTLELILEAAILDLGLIAAFPLLALEASTLVAMFFCFGIRIGFL